MSRVQISSTAPQGAAAGIFQRLFFWRHSQVVRQRSAKPSCTGSNPVDASKKVPAAKAVGIFTYIGNSSGDLLCQRIRNFLWILKFQVQTQIKCRHLRFIKKPLVQKISELNPSGSNCENLHIVMEIGGWVILLHPGKEKRAGGAVGCRVYFDSEASLQSA